MGASKMTCITAFVAVFSAAISTLPAVAVEGEKTISKDAQIDSATVGKMPEFNAETLAERKVTLPRDLPGNRTLVLMTFAKAQQKNADSWVAGLGLMKSTTAWIILPVIDKQNAFVQAMISGGMRVGTPDPKERDHIITLFTNQRDFIAAMQIKSGTKTNYAAVVDRAGKVWASAEGDYSADKAAPLLSALADTGEK
jgi:hypothetical protein